MRIQTLTNQLNEMIKQTKEGHLNWIVEMETTEANPEGEKARVLEEGREWMVDECFTSFSCHYQNQEFCLITYEIIKQSAGKVRTVNMAFLPPAFQRMFDLNRLIEHTVEMDQTLALTIHQLWELLMQQRKEGKPGVLVKISNGTRLQAV